MTTTHRSTHMALSLLVGVGTLALVGCAADQPRMARSTDDASARQAAERAQASAADQYQKQTGAFPGTRTLIGTVEEIRSEQVKINTGDMQSRYLPVKGREKKGLPALNVGDMVILTVNGQNQVVDAHLDGEDHEHRILQGKLAQPLTTGQEKAVITTQNGMEVSHTIRPLARAKVAGVPVGVQALFLIDEAAQISDVTYASVADAKAAGAAALDRSPLKNAFARTSGTISSTLSDNRIGITGADGQEKTYEVRPLMAERLKGMSKGDTVILLLDDEQKVTDIAVPHFVN